MKILKNKDESLSFRLDGAFTNSDYLTTQFVRGKNGEEVKSYFGGFKFLEPEKVEKQLDTVVNAMLNENGNLVDTIFGGAYPKWKDNPEYGPELSVSNKVIFLDSIIKKEEIAESEIKNFIYAIEVTIRPTKNNELFLIVNRAIKTGARAGRDFHDELFDDFFPDTSEEDYETSDTGFDGEDIPF